MGHEGARLRYIRYICSCFPGSGFQRYTCRQMFFLLEGMIFSINLKKVFVRFCCDWFSSSLQSDTDTMTSLLSIYSL